MGIENAAKIGNKEWTIRMNIWEDTTKILTGRTNNTEKYKRKKININKITTNTQGK